MIVRDAPGTASGRYVGVRRPGARVRDSACRSNYGFWCWVHPPPNLLGFCSLRERL